jgi:transglutaminase-like putative cysteine protease
MVRLEFEIGLTYDAPVHSHFLFNVGAAQTAHQHVVQEDLRVNIPSPPVMLTEPHSGNRLFRLQASGELQLRYQAVVDIRHVLDDPRNVRESTLDTLPAETIPFLMASRYCQSDRLTQLAHDTFGAMQPGYSRVEAIRDWVQTRTRFATGTSTTITTALDTLNDQQGVCRDFAHLMIAMCRALNIPARFVTGIDYGADPALGPVDFHAYVEAWLGERWYLFDPTGISPTTGLVRIGTGRDAADTSFCTMFGPVKSYAPSISIRAIEDAELGLALPQRTSLAVSTAGASADLRFVRPRPGTPSVVTFPAAAARMEARHYG